MTCIQHETTKQPQQTLFNSEVAFLAALSCLLTVCFYLVLLWRFLPSSKFERGAPFLSYPLGGAHGCAFPTMITQAVTQRGLQLWAWINHFHIPAALNCYPCHWCSVTAWINALKKSIKILVCGHKNEYICDCGPPKKLPYTGCE